MSFQRQSRAGRDATPVDKKRPKRRIASFPMEHTNAQSLLRLQRDLSLALTFPGSLTETLDRVLDTVCQIEGIDSGGIYTLNFDRRTTDLLIHRGLSPAFVKAKSHYPLSARQSLILMKGRTVCLDRSDIKRSADLDMRREKLCSGIIVPVKHAGQVVASLNLASHTADTIGESSRNAIEAIAAQIGPTIARVRAEAALHMNERNLQALFDSLGDFLFIADAKGGLLHVNPMVVRRLGYSATEVLGKTLLMMHPPDQRHRAAAIVATMLAGKSDCCDIPLMTKSGDLIPVETKVVQGQWNGSTALFGMSRDITERKRTEQELIDRQLQLQALVSELAVAEENERRRIAQGLHDDIGQMLASAKLTLGQVATLLKQEKTRGMVTQVSGYIDHVIQVTRSLTFDLASPVLQRFGLEAAVEDLCDKMTAQHGLPFVVRNDRRPKPLPDDTDIVAFHAVRELLRNIVTHAGAHHVVVSLRRAGEQLRITVKDDGIGFTRMSATGFNRRGGFGLHAIQARMKHLGGSLSFNPVSPHGTRIVLTLPLESPKRPAPKDSSRPRSPSSRAGDRRDEGVPAPERVTQKRVSSRERS